MKKINQKFLTVLLGLMMVGQGWAMSGSSTEASEGEFPSGYDYSFTTTGTTVNISFTENSTRDGLVAYLWNRTGGFQETQMTVSGRTATIALSNQTAGTTLKFACKFAYVGGMAVTKDFEYTVEGGDTPTPPTPTTGIDWSKISWVPNSNEKFKIANFTGASIVNVQNNWGHDGIYVTFANPVTSCSLGSEGCHIQGAGLLMYLSAFSAEETEVTVDENDNRHTFVVYYADGTTGGGSSEGGDSYAPTFTESGTIPDRTETYTYTVVQNSNGTLTITLTLSAALDGWAEPEFYTTGSDRSNMSRWENLTSTYTTTIKYPTTTDTSNWRLRIPYTGAAAEISMSNYTVGADNTHCGTCFQVTF